MTRGVDRSRLGPCRLRDFLSPSPAQFPAPKTRAPHKDADWIDKGATDAGREASRLVLAGGNFTSWASERCGKPSRHLRRRAVSVLDQPNRAERTLSKPCDVLLREPRSPTTDTELCLAAGSVISVRPHANNIRRSAGFGQEIR